MITRGQYHLSFLATGAACVSALLLVATFALAIPVTAQEGGKPGIPVDASGVPIATMDGTRIVAVGGTVTEIIFGLGRGDAVVAVDTSSVYPEAATRLPNVGYARSVSAEGILSLRPSLVVATTEAGPPAALAQLRSAGIPLLLLDAGSSVAAARARIRGVARALDAEPAGEQLVAQLDRDLAAAQARAPQYSTTPRVLFVYARGGGTLLVSGTDTAADEMIKLAGAVNAVSGYGGFKPLTAEAAVAAAPDVILIPTRGVESLGGVQAVLALPGVTLTPAGQAQRVVAMDDLYLLGFGPRLGQAVTALAAQLHPEINLGAAPGSEATAAK